MIRIDRPAAAPSILNTRGKAQREKLCREYDADSAAYDSRAKRFAFNAALYGHASVKGALVTAQHKKCCFCESKVGMDGDVEHYRPKAGYCQGMRQPIEGPGYYWLAYEWTNLLLCCSICNQRFKRNLFPLANATRRARSHHADTSAEEPLFINPAETDPEELIGFRQEIPFAINGDVRAKATIAALGLDREILNERRRDRLGTLTTLFELSQMESSPELAELIREAKDHIARAVLDESEFAAMARAAAQTGYARSAVG